MTELLPKFKYHPDPIASGAVVKSEQPCWCCDKKRGYLSSSGGFTAVEFDEALLEDFWEEHPDCMPNLLVCPWCIADGSAAKKWDASFTSVDEMTHPKLADAIIDEVQHRTPGYVARQEDQWLEHCNDICEFHGDATVEDLRQLTWEQVQEIESISDMIKNIDEWNDFLDNEYDPKEGDVGFYKFVCRHCGKTLFYGDRY